MVERDNTADRHAELVGWLLPRPGMGAGPSIDAVLQLAWESLEWLRVAAGRSAEALAHSEDRVGDPGDTPAAKEKLSGGLPLSDA